MIYYLWQYGHETFPIFISYINIEFRIQSTMEVGQEGRLSFVNLNLCKKPYRITAVIPQKKILEAELLDILTKQTKIRKIRNSQKYASSGL